MRDRTEGKKARLSVAKRTTVTTEHYGRRAAFLGAVLGPSARRFLTGAESRNTRSLSSGTEVLRSGTKHLSGVVAPVFFVSGTALFASRIARFTRPHLGDPSGFTRLSSVGRYAQGQRTRCVFSCSRSTTAAPTTPKHQFVKGGHVWDFRGSLQGGFWGFAFNVSSLLQKMKNLSLILFYFTMSLAVGCFYH